jgi:hypothetical protein
MTIVILSSRTLYFWAMAAAPFTLLPMTMTMAQSISPTDVEEIYIVRSWRGAATTFCAEARTGYTKTYAEDTYTFRAVDTRASDGRVIGATAPIVGTLHACFGSTIESNVFTFYAEGVLNGVMFKGKGECRQSYADFPELGLTPLHCFLDLSGLPTGYVGGQLTTNTLNSRQLLGGNSNPAGYT